MNKLYFGDNLAWLPSIARDSVDLIYLDPPFNSGTAYNLLYKSPENREDTAQYRAFLDSWQWGIKTDDAFNRIMISQTGAAGIISALFNYLGKADIMAYLVMMTVRLIELHKVLKQTGSIYLHCDSGASHYLKVILDSIFGATAFKNEIVWKRSHAHSDGKQGAKHYGRITDVILFYTKGDRYTWNTQYGPYDQEYIDRDYRRIDKDGRRYRIDNLQGPGGEEKGNPFYDVMGVSRYWRYSKERMQALIDAGRVIQTRPGAVPQYIRYLDEMPGVPLQNLWADLKVLNNRSKEALNYPTQKPLSLLERIIRVSSNQGDLVLDPFCGCGTAIEAAQLEGRQWIGIDITALAIDVVERRLHRKGLRRKVDYEVEGIPLDMDGARRLFLEDPHEFERWAITLVDGQPRDGAKKGADQGVDGIIYFQHDAKTIGKAIISVKGGEEVHATHVRDLGGTIDPQGAKIGVFVTIKKTSAMDDAARKGGSVETGGKLRPRIQIFTIAELLSGKKPDLPPVYDVISAAAAARRIPTPQKLPTPEDIREQPQFKYPISGGRAKDAQNTLPFDEPLLVPPRDMKARGGKK
jgi:DNA modification methylase